MTHPELIDIPLRDHLVDLAPLDRFLRSDRVPATAMKLSRLDGLLTGIAIGPELVMPSEWMPLLWGGEGPIFDNVAEMQMIIGAVMSRYNEIVASLRQDPPSFAPVCGKGPNGEWLAEDWAGGFIDAVLLRQRSWTPLIKRNDGRALLMPILLSLPEEEVAGIEGFDFVRDPRLLTEVAELIPDAIVEIDAFWRQRRLPAGTLPQKTGRNARCPCGSGRKYKLCCGR